MPLLKPGNSLSGNSFFIFITRFFPSLANLLVLLWYSRYLPQGVYGNYQRFWIELNVIYPLACFGIHVVMVTYSRDFILSLAGKIKVRSYVLYGLWLALLSAVFGLLEYKALGGAFVVPFLFMVAWALSTAFESFLIVCRYYRSLTAINVGYALAFCFIHWYVLRVGFSLPLLFSLLFIIIGLRLCIYGGMVMVDAKQRDSAGYEEHPLEQVKSLWLHLGVYDVTQMLFSWIDKFIIALLLTAPVSAVYYNGSQNIPFLPLLLGAAGSAVLMQLAGGKKDDETGNIIAYMKQSGRLISCIVFPLFFFLLFFRHELFVVLLPKYEQSIPIFVVSLLVLPLRAYSFTTVLQRLHKGNIINIGSLADLIIACGLMYPFYLWMGLPGVALSFVITTYIQAGFYLVYAARLLRVKPMALIPYADWLVKLIVFVVMFITIHYACRLYFTEEIRLFLGMVIMVIAMVVSLLLELNKQKKHVSI